jgi:hypothetical protein
MASQTHLNRKTCCRVEWIYFRDVVEVCPILQKHTNEISPITAACFSFHTMIPTRLNVTKSSSDEKVIICVVN